MHDVRSLSIRFYLWNITGKKIDATDYARHRKEATEYNGIEKCESLSCVNFVLSTRNGIV